MSDFGNTGAARPGEGAGEFNLQQFIMQRLINRTATCALVQVVKVDPSGFVDVLPMVNQLDGDGQPMPHGPIHRVPFFRLQGGASAIILNPVVSDIGLAMFASHDISSVKATRKPSNPGSRRRFDMADALYLGGFLNAAPTQYIQFTAAGIAIVSPTLTHNGKDIGSTHKHTAPSGGGTTSPPL